MSTSLHSLIVHGWTSNETQRFSIDHDTIQLLSFDSVRVWIY